MMKRARKMIATAMRKDGHFSSIDVGTVVQIAAKDVDRARTDVANITGVVVDHTHIDGVLHYRIAARAGLLKSVYARHQLKPLTVSPSLVGLQDILQSWPSLKNVGERACMRVVSAVGGQGLVHCNCAGRCVNERCKCWKTKRLCNSRCHKRNKACRNHDE
jgi:hypothetical protein